MQAGLDLERAVQVGVIDEALPAHRAARLLEIHPHDQVERVLHPLGEFLQSRSILDGCLRVVDGAGADHDEQAIVLSIEDVLDNLPSFHDGTRRRIGDRQFDLQLLRRDQP